MNQTQLAFTAALGVVEMRNSGQEYTAAWIGEAIVLTFATEKDLPPSELRRLIADAQDAYETTQRVMIASQEPEMLDISRITHAINSIETKIALYPVDLRQHIFGYALASLYRTRGGYYVMEYTDKVNPDDLQSALNDLAKSRSFPDVCYDLMTQFFDDFRPQVADLQQSLGSHASEKKGCLPILIAITATVLFIGSRLLA